MLFGCWALFGVGLWDGGFLRCFGLYYFGICLEFLDVLGIRVFDELTYLEYWGVFQESGWLMYWRILEYWVVFQESRR